MACGDSNADNTGNDNKEEKPSVTVKPIPIESNTIYTYTLGKHGNSGAYDEALAAACVQGVLNRDNPCLYLFSKHNEWATYWYDKFTADGWMAGKKVVELKSFDELIRLGLNKVKGLIVWDTKVPATVNVATTMAGIKDAIVVTDEMAKTLKDKYDLKIIKDFNGQFTGQETGSAKNDAYRWAIREFMDKGLCSTHRMCLNDDSYLTRMKGDVSYIITRDLAVSGKCFVYDLSPWGDEKPKDDQTQATGLDLETYKMLLNSLYARTNGKSMTEIAGFFSFQKYSNMPGYPSSHEPVPTEWENVYLISPYNCYQNTVANDCMNQSFHMHAPLGNLKQGRPELGKPESGKTYICILMADYDSTTPLYEFMPNIWDNLYRGKLPLLWGINPNLTELYPDIFSYLYSTRAPGDYFASDASCAGYMNPNRIKPENLGMFVEHNQKFFNLCDMSIAPMVLDTNQPTSEVKDAFAQFAPDGYSTIIMNFHPGNESRSPQPQVWKGMPVMNLINSTCNFSNVEEEAQIMSREIKTQGTEPSYYIFRIVWTSPERVYKTVERLKELRPELDIEVLDGYNFFHYFKLSKQK